MGIGRVRRIYKQYLDNRRQLQVQAPYQVQFYNCWDQPNEQMYWRQFIEAKKLLLEDKKIAIFSVFGDRSLIQKVNADVKIFYSAENLKRSNFSQYADHALGENSIDLAMGFEVFEDPRYIRFPLWMDYMFPADSTEETIRAKCAKLRFPISTQENRRFCSMVASNSADGLRDEMFNAISRIAHVDSAGRYLHNDDSLVTQFADNKLAYLQSYLFNICPENTAAYGYTTEKIFEAISCGCIPIYWGAELADKAVINTDAIIFWDRENQGREALSKIAELHANPKMQEEFLAQPRLTPYAEEYILDTFSTIDSKLRAIINSK